VLGEELEADPAALLVDLLDDDVEHVATADHVLDVTDATRADGRGERDQHVIGSPAPPVGAGRPRARSRSLV